MGPMSGEITLIEWVDNINNDNPSPEARELISSTLPLKKYPTGKRSSVLKIANMILAQSETGEQDVLEAIIENDDSLLLTAPIIEFLRLSDNDTEETEACAPCIPYLPGMLMRPLVCVRMYFTCPSKGSKEKLETLDEVIAQAEEKSQMWMNSCAKYLEIVEGRNVSGMIDWEVMMKQLNHLIDNDKIDRRQRTEYIIKSEKVFDHLVKWNPLVICDLMYAIMVNPRSLSVEGADDLVIHLSKHLGDGYKEVQEGLGRLFDIFLQGVPTFKQYTSLKRILVSLHMMMNYDDKWYRPIQKLFYGVELSHGALLANRVLLTAHIYEADWLGTTLSYLDTHWINIHDFVGSLLTSSNKETPAQLQNRLNSIYSILNAAEREDGGLMKSMVWLMVSVNEEIEKRLGGRRDLNLFYLPAPKPGKGRSGLFEQEPKPQLLKFMPESIQSSIASAVRMWNKNPDAALSVLCVDKAYVNLEPRAQIEAMPKDIAKLVSPHKLRQEVEKTERVNRMILPKVPCFNCTNGWCRSSKPSHISVTSLQRPVATWSYSRSYVELEYEAGANGAELRPKRIWRTAGKSIGSGDNDGGGDDDGHTIDFDEDMCRVLEEAYSEGEHFIYCSLHIDDLVPNDMSPRGRETRRVKNGHEDVEVEINMQLMKVVDLVNRTERDLVRNTTVEQHAPHHEPEKCTSSGKLKLKKPDLSTGFAGDAFVKCWVCFGTGEISQWFNKEVIATIPSPSVSMKRQITNDDGVRLHLDGSNLDDQMPMCPICYCDPGIYGLSVECDHLFCKDCAGDSLKAMLESGQFPANCPMCRAEGKKPDEYGNDKEPVGLISRPVLTFLVERDVITKQFQFRFVNAMRKSSNSYVKKHNKDEVIECCREGCGTFLHAPVGAAEDEVTLGQCPCGQVMCLLCSEPVEILNKFKVVNGTKQRHSHNCPNISEETNKKQRAAAASRVGPDLALLSNIGKKCPACSMFIVKNAGCNVMMCGDTAHGSLQRCLQNGGCGMSFNWNELTVCPDAFNEVGGERLHGLCVTARQVKDHPKCLRAGCNYYKCHDDITTKLNPNPANRKSGGGDYCCLDCKQGKSTHHKYCHKIDHPSTFNAPVGEMLMHTKAGDECIKWLVPFTARLLKIDFDLEDQPPKSYADGNFEKLLAALKPTHYENTAGGEGYQFTMEVIGRDGQILHPKSIYTRDVNVTRHHSSIMPKKVPRKIDMNCDPIFPSGIQVQFGKPIAGDSSSNVLSSIPNFLMAMKDAAKNIMGYSPSFSILFDLGDQSRVVGLRSILLSHFAFKVSFSSLSAEEASHAKHFFQDYKVHQQTVIYDTASLEVDTSEKRAPGPPKIPPSPPLRQAAAMAAPLDKEYGDYEPQTIEERRLAYQMIADERQMILNMYGRDQACECPGCGIVIVKNGGDDNLMCGCEAEAAGGTMAKALAGGGCGLKFNFTTKNIIGNGRPGAPMNDRQWRFANR